MSAVKISQREARRLRRRVEELERDNAIKRNAYASDYPGGVHLGSMTLEADWFRGRLEAARMLGHPLVVVMKGTQAMFYAIK